MPDTSDSSPSAPPAASPVPPGSVWSAAAAPGGWVRLVNQEGLKAFLRVGRGTDGWSRVHTAVMASNEPIREHSWRGVPFETIEVAASVASPFATELALPEQGTPVADLDSLFRSDAPTTMVVYPTAEQAAVDLEGLKAPAGPLGEEFLRQVASAYVKLVAANQAPAPAIAAHTNTPVRTVHGWIRSARKRGFLPPARRGRAGVAQVTDAAEWLTTDLPKIQENILRRIEDPDTSDDERARLRLQYGANEQELAEAAEVLGDDETA